MGWTKADRELFLKSCDEIRGIMPQEVISKQAKLFEDVLEVDTPNPRYQKIKLILKLRLMLTCANRYNLQETGPN